MLSTEIYKGSLLHVSIFVYLTQTFIAKKQLILERQDFQIIYYSCISHFLCPMLTVKQMEN